MNFWEHVKNGDSVLLLGQGFHDLFCDISVIKCFHQGGLNKFFNFITRIFMDFQVKRLIIKLVQSLIGIYLSI